MSNANLQAAREVKNDDFFTRYDDIAAEVDLHVGAFYKKRVYCNCDDPRHSQFWAYFHRNFSRLGLSALIATGYTADGQGVFGIYCGGEDDNLECGIKGNAPSGDYASDFALRFLLMADIVATNPPFSVFREFVQFLHKHGKRFLIIGPVHALKAKGVIDLLGSGVFVCGQTRPALFTRPDGSVERMGNTTWLNGLRDGVFPAPLQLVQKYDQGRYPMFDNYAAISVDKLSEIPCDYKGAVGVPVTILQVFRPDQWELIGADEASGKGASRGLYDEMSPDRHAVVDGKRKFTRVFVRRRF